MAGDGQWHGEGEEAGGIETGMGDQEGVAPRGDAVEPEAAVYVGLDALLAAAHPDIGAPERRVQQAVEDRSDNGPLT